MTCHLLVIDIDGTLVDSAAQHRDALKIAMERASIFRRDVDWSSYRHRTDSGIFAEAHERSFGVAPDLQACEAFERLLEDEYEVNAEPPELMAGAMELVQRVQSSAVWRIVFATGSFRRPAVQKLRLLHCNEPVLVTASDYRSRCEIVANAVVAGWCGLPKEERGTTVSVGDGVWDAQAARDLGLPFVGIARASEAQALRRLGAAAVFPDCRGVWAGLAELLAPSGTT